MTTPAEVDTATRELIRERLGIRVSISCTQWYGDGAVVFYTDHRGDDRVAFFVVGTLDNVRGAHSVWDKSCSATSIG